MRRVISWSLAVLLLSALPLGAWPYQRTTPNLHPNPTIPSVSGWTGSGATFASGVTRTAGSGSLAVTQNQLLVGPTIPVTAGKTYTCSVYFMGTNAPVDFMRLTLALTTSGGASLPNAPEASTWGYSAPNAWQEAVVMHTVAAGEAFMRILITRAQADMVNGTVPIYIDDVYCGEGISFDNPPTPKVAFNGGITKVDTLGSVSIKQSDSTFKTEFLRCMFGVASDNWAVYAPNGWNCSMCAGSLATVQRAVDNGLPYSFFNLAPYIAPGSPQLGDLAALNAALGAILSSPYAGNLVGYYYDQEPGDAYTTVQTILNQVIALDTVGGVRQRPIYILQGNPGVAAAFGSYANMTGSYQSRAAPLDTRLLILSHMTSQPAPVVFGQIQQASGKTTTQMRDQVMATLYAGGSAIGYWHTGPITDEAWYTAMPGIVTEGSTFLDNNNCTCSP